MKAMPTYEKGHTPFTINHISADRTFKGFAKFLSHFKIAVFEVIKTHSTSRLLFYNIV